MAAVQLQAIDLNRGADIVGSNHLVYTSRVRIERKAGPMRLAYLPAERELRQLFCRVRSGLDGRRPQEISP